MRDAVHVPEPVAQELGYTSVDIGHGMGRSSWHVYEMGTCIHLIPLRIRRACCATQSWEQLSRRNSTARRISGAHCDVLSLLSLPLPIFARARRTCT